MQEPATKPTKFAEPTIADEVAIAIAIGSVLKLGYGAAFKANATAEESSAEVLQAITIAITKGSH